MGSQWMLAMRDVNQSHLKTTSSSQSQRTNHRFGDMKMESKSHILIAWFCNKTLSDPTWKVYSPVDLRLIYRASQKNTSFLSCSCVHNWLWKSGQRELVASFLILFTQSRRETAGLRVKTISARSGSSLFFFSLALSNFAAVWRSSWICALFCLL